MRTTVERRGAHRQRRRIRSIGAFLIQIICLTWKMRIKFCRSSVNPKVFAIFFSPSLPKLTWRSIPSLPSSNLLQLLVQLTNQILVVIQLLGRIQLLCVVEGDSQLGQMRRQVLAFNLQILCRILVSNFGNGGTSRFNQTSGRWQQLLGCVDETRLGAELIARSLSGLAF